MGLSHTKRPGSSIGTPSQSETDSLASVPGPFRVASPVPPGPTDGPSMLAEIAANAPNFTLDTVLRRHPRANPLTDSELDDLVRVLRAERTAIDVKIEKAKAKKQGADNEAEVQDA